jgi:hypothetical protein
MVPTELLCNRHLLGEHGEIHKHRHNFVKRHSIAGRRGQIEPMAMAQRHDELAAELLKRGMNHQSPYEMPDLSHLPTLDRVGKVDQETSLRDLHNRCEACRDRYQKSRSKKRSALSFSLDSFVDMCIIGT